jgi:glucosylceramidase
MKNRISVYIIVLIALLSMNSNCSNKNKPADPPAPEGKEISWWMTKTDQSVLLQKQNSNFSFGSPATTNQLIEIDSAQIRQTVDGFGYTLTGGSAYLINKLAAAQRSSLLQELFGSNDNSIRISYLRISIGASDLSPEVFSYDDMPAGQTDPTLANFSLSKDTVDLIPVLKEIIAINPNLKIMASPWSPPVWMKDNGNSIGGSLQTQYYGVDAQYFVKYIQAMLAKGITIHAITPQNEPQHGGNNPSMVMSAAQQATFIKNNLGPAFQSAGVTAKIIVWDHNCDNANFPITVLNDAAAKPFIDGSAFHLYAGDISALSAVKAAHPDKNLYFTEQWTGANGTFSGDLKWHITNVIIGSMRNWSKVALEWNLANDPTYNPHTPGGCTECKGALTLNGNIIRNVSYYIIAHASKFVPPGSVVMSSTVPNDNIPNVVFKTPEGKKVMIVLNNWGTETTINIKYQNKTAPVTLPASCVTTLTW